MKYYLLTKTTYFYDGHGDADDGAIEKCVVTSKEYPDIDTEITYFDNGGELLPYNEDYDEENYNLFAQDGYNCSRTDYSFKELAKFEVVSTKSLIALYEAL